jgi:Domain of unknown function (DUF3854)
MKMTTLNLTPGDLAMFDKIHVPVELLEEAGIRRVTNRQARDEFAFHFGGCLDGIMFPYHVPTGERVNARIRRDVPDVDENLKQKNKYVSADRDHRRFYYPPNCRGLLADANCPVIFVEAEKSVLSLWALSRRTGRSMFPVGTGGNWAWKGKIGKVTTSEGGHADQRGPLKDFDHFVWKAREVVICLDANVATNPNVRSAERALRRELERRGAVVHCARIPEEPEINGPDDFIGRHTDEDFLQILKHASTKEPRYSRARIDPAFRCETRTGELVVGRTACA